MNKPAQILIADDNAANVDILKTRLSIHGYEILTAADGEEALDIACNRHPDLILLDIMMPKMDGIKVCRRIKSDPALPFTPIILVTAKSDPADVAVGLEAGAEEYLTKPVEQTALVARVKSMLRIKSLYDQTQDQAARLQSQAEELIEWNQTLSDRVEQQLAELDLVRNLKRFFSPQVSELITSPGNEKLLESHRREITVVFCDLRGFTAFAEGAEPEEVMEVLQQYHATVGPIIFDFEATLEHFAGDGLMALFNDPIPCADPSARAVCMADAMRQAMGDQIGRWDRRGYELGFGVGIAVGYATMGQIGFEGRFHYGAIGSVLNLASRLCDNAKDGQILMTQRVGLEVRDMAELEFVGELSLKGFSKPVPSFNLVQVTEEVELS